MLFRSEADLVDPETAQEINAMVSEMRPAYRDTVLAAIDEWRGRCAASGASYETVFTDQPYGIGLRRAFAARQALP